MHLTYKEEIKIILERRVDENLLTGYYSGIFSPEKDKFYAVTVVDINTIEYSDYSFYHESLLGSSGSHYDFEKTRVYQPNGSWSHKSTEQCIEEGIYRYFSISFIATLFEGEWFIQPHLSFYGALIDVDGIKQRHEKSFSPERFWVSTMFMEREPSQYEGELIRRPTLEEFDGQPEMVVHIKQRKKENINTLYCRYINAEFLEPFFERLRISNPAEFVDTGALRYGYTMIFPLHKRYTLFCAQVKNDRSEWTLQYFLYHNEKAKFYKWNYFSPEKFEFSFFYSKLIIADLKQISNWDDDGFLDSSCTMDDEIFWEEYVFKINTASGEYRYLQTI
jgi:hypothetical protein